MNIHELGIPNIGVKNYGNKRDPLEMVEATVRLEAWDGYLVERRENAKVTADGTVLVQFGCNTRSDAAAWQTEVQAYHHLLEDQFELRDNIVDAVIANIDELKGYLADDDPGVPQITAANAAAFDLRPFIGPRSVSVLEETKDGIAYLEWSLNCTWDTEHGLAVTTHRTRIIDLDRGETDIYKIFEDNGTLKEELKNAGQLSKLPKPTLSKPWWKFW